MSNPPPGIPGGKLRIIRISMLTGVLMLGAIAYFLTQERGPTSPEMARPLQIANIAVLVGVAVGLLVVQRAHASQREPARRTTLNIIGWALGEAAALFGGAHYLLIGSPIPYLVGLAMMLASLVVVPIRE